MKTYNKQPSYTARIARAKDGDTILVLMFIGFGIWREMVVRIQGIDSWELDGQNQQRAKDAASIITLRYEWRECVLHPHPFGPDKHGRIRANVTVNGRDLATDLVELGVAWFTKDSQEKKT